MTAAVYGVAVKAAEKEAAAYDIPLEVITAALSEAVGAPDRTAAIVVFALIDDLMITFLSKNLDPGIKGGLATLFERNGILSTAHGRITLSAALRWIERGTYRDLNLLRDIRNRFAHHVAIRSFTDNSIRGYIASLSKRADAIYKTDEAELFRPIENLSARELYLFRAISAVDGVCMDLTHLPAARLHHVNPRDMFKGGFEAAPEPLQNLKRVVARFTLQVAGTADTIRKLHAQLEANR